MIRIQWKKLLTLISLTISWKGEVLTSASRKKLNINMIMVFRLVIKCRIACVKNCFFTMAQYLLIDFLTRLTIFKQNTYTLFFREHLTLSAAWVSNGSLGFFKVYVAIKYQACRFWNTCWWRPASNLLRNLRSMRHFIIKLPN